MSKATVHEVLAATLSIHTPGIDIVNGMAIAKDQRNIMWIQLAPTLWFVCASEFSRSVEINSHWSCIHIHTQRHTAYRPLLETPLSYIVYLALSNRLACHTLPCLTEFEFASCVLHCLHFTTVTK